MYKKDKIGSGMERERERERKCEKIEFFCLIIALEKKIKYKKDSTAVVWEGRET